MTYGRLRIPLALGAAMLAIAVTCAACSADSGSGQSRRADGPVKGLPPGEGGSDEATTPPTAVDASLRSDAQAVAVSIATLLVDSPRAVTVSGSGATVTMTSYSDDARTSKMASEDVTLSNGNTLVGTTIVDATTGTYCVALKRTGPAGDVIWHYSQTSITGTIARGAC